MIFKKIRKGHVDWQKFLCSTPARDYVFQKDAYEDQIDMAAEYIRNADSIIVGAGFYPYPSEEAKWGYWSKHALMNRFDPLALPLYSELYDIVKDKEYFVLTTNVDHQFYKAGFDENRIFATQGDYGKIQCQRACHQKTYDAEELFHKMDEARKDSLIRLNMDEAVVPERFGKRAIGIGGDMARAITDIRGQVL